MRVVQVKTSGRVPSIAPDGTITGWRQGQDGQPVRTELELGFNYPETIAEAVSIGGEETVLDFVCREMTIKMQAFIRSRIEQGKTEGEIQAEFSSYNPFEVKTSTDPVSKVLKMVNKSANLSPEQIAALIAQLQASQA